MTGDGNGMCVLKLSAEPDQPIIGLAGRAGRPVRQPPNCSAELEHLHRRARHIETVLRVIHSRIKELGAYWPEESIGA